MPGGGVGLIRIGADLKQGPGERYVVIVDRDDQRGLAAIIGEVDRGALAEEQLRPLAIADLDRGHQRAVTVAVANVRRRAVLKQVGHPAEVAGAGDELQRGFAGRPVETVDRGRARFVEDLLGLQRVTILDRVDEIVALRELCCRRRCRNDASAGHRHYCHALPPHLCRHDPSPSACAAAHSRARLAAP